MFFRHMEPPSEARQGPSDGRYPRLVTAILPYSRKADTREMAGQSHISAYLKQPEKVVRYFGIHLPFRGLSKAYKGGAAVTTGEGAGGRRGPYPTPWADVKLHVQV